jgi:hypothetical protein
MKIINSILAALVMAGPGCPMLPRPPLLPPLPPLPAPRLAICETPSERSLQIARKMPRAIAAARAGKFFSSSWPRVERSGLRFGTGHAISFGK